MSAQLKVGVHLHLHAESDGARAALKATPVSHKVSQPTQAALTELMRAPWEVTSLEARGRELERWRVTHPLWGEASLKLAQPQALSDDEVMWRFQTDLELSQLAQLHLKHLQRPLCWGEVTLEGPSPEPLSHPWGVLLSPPQGQRLSERLKQGPLSLREAHLTFTPLARELALLHEQGLLHRAIQPDHLYLTTEGGYLCHQHWEAEIKAIERATAADLLRGESSPQHGLMAAPEWFEGGDLTVSSDVYALAVTLLTALNPSARSWRDAPPRYRAVLAERLSPQPSARGEMSAFARELELSALSFEYKSASDEPSERLELHEVVARVRDDELGWHLVASPMLEGQPYPLPELEVMGGDDDEFCAWGQLSVLSEAVERARAVSASLEDASRVSALVERNATLEAEAEAMKRERLSLAQRERALEEREAELARRLEHAQATQARVEQTKREVEEELQRRYQALKEAHERASEERKARLREAEEAQQRLIEAREMIRQKGLELKGSEDEVRGQAQAAREQLQRFERAQEALQQEKHQLAELAERARVIKSEAESERREAEAHRKRAERIEREARQVRQEARREREKLDKEREALEEARAEVSELRERAQHQLDEVEALREETERHRSEAAHLRDEAEEHRQVAERERASAEAEHMRATRLRTEAERLLEEAQAAQSAPRPITRPLSVSAPLTSVSIEGEVNNPTPGAQLTVRLGEERLNLRFCPAGSSLQGSAEGEGKPEEQPQHTLHLTRPYWLAETPITQALWQMLCGAHPSKHHGPQLPVEGVAWASALRFCNLLSEQMGLEPVYELGEGPRALTHLNAEARGWRLPTEAEWEHAARAGQDPSWRYAGGSKLDAVGWFSGNSSDHAHPVGQKAPNAWGLLDMSGGVWEWCQDAWSKDAYRARVSGGERALIDPLHDVAQPLPRVIRGGSFYDYPMSCRLSARPALEVTGGYGVGFRPLLPA